MAPLIENQSGSYNTSLVQKLQSTSVIQPTEMSSTHFLTFHLRKNPKRNKIEEILKPKCDTLYWDAPLSYCCYFYFECLLKDALILWGSSLCFYWQPLIFSCVWILLFVVCPFDVRLLFWDGIVSYCSGSFFAVVLLTTIFLVTVVNCEKEKKMQISLKLWSGAVHQMATFMFLLCIVPF